MNLNSKEARLIAAASALSKQHKNVRSQLGYSDPESAATKAVDAILVEYEEEAKHATHVETSPYALGFRR